VDARDVVMESYNVMPQDVGLHNSIYIVIKVINDVIPEFLKKVPWKYTLKWQYLEGPATGHLDTGVSWFPCVYKRMLGWFPSFQVATTCLSCNPTDLNFLVTFSPFLCTCKITTATG
jgi:hypothetical protein